MSSETQAPTISPKSVWSPLYWNALGLLWGAVMLTLYALWLSKFLPLIPLNPEVKPVSPPATWVIAVLGTVAGLSYLVFGWYTASVRMLTLRPDLAGEAKLHQRLGLMLIILGVFLAAMGLYLVFTLRLDGFAESVGLCLFALIPLLTGLVLQRSPGTGDLVTFALPRAGMLQRVLLALGGVGIIAFLWLAFGKQLGLAWLPELGAVIFESLLLITCGLWLSTSKPEERSPLAMRCLLLILGGVTGLILTLEAFFRTVYWRQDVLLGGIGGWMGHNSWEFWLCVYSGLVGLALIFGAMLLARSEVRNQPTLRQFYFGYNAVASGLLLVAFLAAFNVLTYAMFPLTSEWSARGLISLSDQSKTILGSLKNRPLPITAYVLLSPNSGTYNDVRNLLDNCQAYAPQDKFLVKYVSPDSNDATFDELAQYFPEVRGVTADALRGAKGRGVLLVQGALPNSKEEKDKLKYAFISDRKLAPTPQMGEGGAKRVFNGESEIMRELSFILRDQKKFKIYILQGDGELAMGSSFNQNEDEAGVLVDRLSKDNYLVKGLSFNDPPEKKERPADVEFVTAGPNKRKEVPPGTFAVVVLGPLKMQQDALDALDDFMMKRDGKLLVTLGFGISKDDKKFVRSGIEDFLQKFGVGCDLNKPDEGFVFKSELVASHPYNVIASPPDKTTNDLAKRFLRRGFEFFICRAVRVNDVGQFKGDVILQADPDMSDEGVPYLVDNSLSPFLTPKKYFDKANESQRKAHVQSEIPVAVAVSQMGIKPTDLTKPRLVVFGNTSFASNQRLFNSRQSYALLVGALEWMGERTIEGIPPKEQGIFQLPPAARIDRMIWGPLWFMTLAIVGLATGVWLVRRR